VRLVPALDVLARRMDNRDHLPGSGACASSVMVDNRCDAGREVAQWCREDGSGSCQLLNIALVYWRSRSSICPISHGSVWGSAGFQLAIGSHMSVGSGQYCLSLYGSLSAGGASQSNSLAVLGWLWNGLAILLPDPSERSATVYPDVARWIWYNGEA
jgi:hypothetical protein